MNIEPKPRIRPCRTSAGAIKWHCTTGESGTHVREGKGYTPAEAYERWKRCGDHTSRRYCATNSAGGAL